MWSLPFNLKASKQSVLPFKNLRVLELASVLAGPAVGSFFAELGAEVVKIENKKNGGDVTRTWRNANEEATLPYSAYYASVNFGKKNIFLDLNDKEDRKILKRWLKNTDILIHNFKVGDDKKFNLEAHKLHKKFPKLIIGAISGFPEGINKVAYDVVLQAETGYISMTGFENQLAKMPVAFIDLLCAHQLKEGLLIALMNRAKTSKGCLVSCNLYETAIASLANQASNYLMSNLVAKPMGTLHPNIAPYGDYFETNDGKYVVLAVGSDKQFMSLCQVLNQPDLATNAHFKTNKSRLSHRQLLAEKLSPLFKQLKVSEVELEFSKEQIPFGIIKTLDEVLESPHAKSLQIEQDFEGGTLKAVRTVAFTIDNLKT